MADLSILTSITRDQSFKTVTVDLTGHLSSTTSVGTGATLLAE